MLLLLVAAVLAATPDEASNPDYVLGVDALKAKNTGEAISAFERCISAEPANVDCHWEVGWAYWTRGDWARVVSHWEAVSKTDPTREGLDRYLSQARDNLGLEAILAKGRGAAPRTFHSPVPEGTTVRLRAVGDLMIGSSFPEGSLQENPEATFADIGSWLTDADFTFGNMEGPICDGGETDKCKPGAAPGSCYAFKSPSPYAAIYKAAGFDVVSTANNHAGDFGEFCREETERLLDAQGIAHSGRPGDIAELTVNGLKIAVVGFHTSRNSHYVNDHETAATLVRALKTDHDLVIVSFHGGAEGGKALHVPEGEETFYGENRGNLRAFTHTVVDAGADLVIGHGPHVLRGMEVYKGHLVMYSLGNFATYGRFNLSGWLGVGAVVEVTLDKDGRFVSGKILPTKQVDDGIPARDMDEQKAIDLVRTLSQEDFPGTAVQVAQDGSLKAP